MLRSAALALVAVPALLLAVTGVAVPASATGAPGCVSAREFSEAQHGMWKHRVHLAFGTTGHRDYVRHRNGHVIERYTYRPCADYGGAWIRYRDGHLYEKTGVF